MGHVLGAEKDKLLIRGRGRPTVYGGRTSEILSIPAKQVSLGSLRVGTIHVQSPTPHARALPAYFGQFSHYCGPQNHELLGNGFQSSQSPKRRRMRCRRLPTTRPTPRGLQEPICVRKKCVIWTRWRPVPVKNVNYPRAPRNRNSGLVGPHTTPPIVNYKYMTSTL
jgi:hypothetical protein